MSKSIRSTIWTAWQARSTTSLIPCSPSGRPVHGAINRLKLTKRTRSRIFQASTSEVYSDGSQTRSFCYADDLIDGIIGVMGMAGSATGPVNLGNVYEVSILELASQISPEPRR